MRSDAEIEAALEAFAASGGATKECPDCRGKAIACAHCFSSGRVPVHDEAGCMRAALDAADAAAWRPIAEAPRDPYKRLDLWVVNSRTGARMERDGYWGDVGSVGWRDRGGNRLDWQKDDEDGPISSTVSLFRPLPSPPPQEPKP